MDKIHIRNMFQVFLSLTESLGAPRLMVPSDETSGSSLNETNEFGVEFSHNKKLRVRLICTDYFGNSKEEVKGCFLWAKRSAVVYQQDSEDKVNGLFLRMKISQGVFDFRKTRERLFRIIVELFENGSVTRTGASTITPLFPKKRQVVVETEADEGSGVTVPIYWYGEDGKLIDHNPNVSPEDSSSLGTNNSSLSVNTSNQLMESPDVQSMHELQFTDTLFGEIQMESDQILTAIDHADYQSSAHYGVIENENYMVLYNGNAEVVGNFRALNFYKASDINLKEDIRLLEEDHDCRAALLKINGVEYKFKQGVSHATNKRFIGYIAQQIESVVPEAVQLIDGILHVDYESLIPYLSESVKQNYTDITRMDSEMDNMKRVIGAMYDKFVGVDQPTKPAPKTSRKSRKIIGWTAAVLVSTLIALAIGIVFFTDWTNPGLSLTPVERPHRPLVGLLPAAISERKMLLELYASMKAENNLWNLTEPHCSWSGISCNSTTGRVTQIVMPFFGGEPGYDRPYGGTIPPSIGNFTELQRLDLSANNLISTIPESISNLKNLATLKLYSNLLTGTVPDLRGLQNLRVVDLSANLLTFSLSMLMQIPSLETLFMEGNNINSMLPQKITDSLVQVNLSGCGLYGTIPESWTKSNLTSITLRLNDLSGSIPCFGEHVTTLITWHNSLNGDFCGSSLRSITQLDIGYNKLTGVFDLPNVNISNMTVLSITSNLFTSFMPSSVDQDQPILPSQCSAASNVFKCPIPAWSSACEARCI